MKNYIDSVENKYDTIISHLLRSSQYLPNKFNGEKVLLLSSVLRIPLVKTLFNNEVSSEFLNNFQLIGFFDLGSSWNENSPFSSQSDVNTWIIKEPGSVFQAEIENSKNPWLASYGFGIRSLITDYYIKLDIII